MNIIQPISAAAWGSGFGSFGWSRGTLGSGALSRDTAGFVAGADVTVDGTWRIGLAGGYTHTWTDQRAQLSAGEVESGFGAIYGGASFGAIKVRLGAIGDAIAADGRRVGPVGNTLSAAYSGWGAAGFGEVGYSIEASPTASIEPFVGASVIHFWRDGFTETGGAGALTVFGQAYDLQTVTAGTRAAVTLSETMPISLRGMLGYRHAFGDVVPTALLAFAGGGTQFQTAGIPIARSAAVVEAGLSWQANPAVVVELTYSGQIGDRAEDHGVKGSFQVRF